MPTKPRATKKTTTVIEEPKDEQEFQLPVSSEDAALQEIIDQYPNGQRKFRLEQWKPGGLEFLLSTQELIDEEFIQNNYGPGRYIVKVLIDRVKRYEYEMRIGPKPGNAAAAAAEAQPFGTPKEPQPGKPLDTVEFLQTLLLGVLRQGPIQPVQTTPVNELAEALKTIHSLQPNAGNAGKEYTDGLKAGIELAKDLGGSGDWKSDLFRTLRDTLPTVAGMLPTLRAPLTSGVTHSPGVPATATLPPNAENGNMERILYEGIQKLKKQCVTGVPPQLIIDWVIANATEPQYQDFIRAAFNFSFEEFAAIDPEINGELYKSWFRALYDGLRQEFKEQDNMDVDTEGEAGDDSNAADNAPIGKRREQV